MINTNNNSEPRFHESEMIEQPTSNINLIDTNSLLGTPVQQTFPNSTVADSQNSIVITEPSQKVKYSLSPV
jgi:hypothetical protein